MKQKLKQLLICSGWYNYIKYSSSFYLYELLFKPQVKQRKEAELKFYRSFLTPCSLIFDIGANDGHKTEAFINIAHNVICCEPDLENCQKLRGRFGKLREKVVVKQVALAAAPGEQTMYVHHKGSAFNTLNSKFKEIVEADEMKRWNEKVSFVEKMKVHTTTLNLLIQEYGIPYFIKVDVEGYELEVIKGLSTPIPYLSLECLLPDFKEELLESIALLKNLGAPLSFNVAINEQLQFEKNISLTTLNDLLDNFYQQHFELIVKMEIV